VFFNRLQSKILMKTFHEEVQERTVKTLTGVQCDLCGCWAENNLWVEYKDSWVNPENSHEVVDVSISMSTRPRYSVEGRYEDWEFDICPTCFNQKLVPWMMSQNAHPQINERYT